MHSFKGWFATFLAQAKFTDEEIGICLHWNARQMRRRYNQSRSSPELEFRMTILRLLAYLAWESRSPGLSQVSQTQALRGALPCLQGKPSDGVAQTCSTFVF